MTEEQPVHVAFDEQIFLLQRHGGVSKYFVELIRALEENESRVRVDLPFSTTCNEHALQAWPGRLNTARGPLRPYPQLAVAAARPRRRSEGVDVVHHTFYSGRFLRDYPLVPKVVTVHDMIPELLGERGRFGNPHMAKREYVRRAAAVICVSESARQDMIALYGEPDCPVLVVHHGVDPSFRAGGPRPQGFPEKYLLFVGRRAGYKDFATLARAFRGLAATDPDLRLVCVGGGPLAPEDREQLGEAQHKVGQHSLPDEDMAGAYQNAAAFIFPSRYEGFGLPALEAMSAGAPTVLANSSSLPEVGGGAAVYFEPGDSDDLAQVVSDLLGDPSEAKRLRAAGAIRAKGFSWQACARATTSVYEAALDRKPDPHPWSP